MTNDEQLDLWVQGVSKHNEELGRCCPDFSCCQPSLLASPEVRMLFREAYKSGDEALQFRILGEFLSRGLAALTDANVYIVGLDSSRREEDEDVTGHKI